MNRRSTADSQEETIDETHQLRYNRRTSVLKRCQPRGIKVAFATARSTQASARMLDQFTPDIFIGYGGALVLAEEKMVSRFDIPADISSRLIDECLQAPEIFSVFAINETAAYINKMDPSVTEISHYQCVDFSHIRDTTYLKISVTASNPGAVEHIASGYPMLDLLRYSGEDLYRFANGHAVKWNAVKAAEEYYSISTDAIVAFGDDINDLEMLQNCGLGVAVANAVDEVKAIADDICGTNDSDGVAKWLDKRFG